MPMGFVAPSMRGSVLITPSRHSALVLVVAVLAVQAACAPGVCAGAAPATWQHILDRPGGDPAVDHHGRLWVFSHESCLHMLPAGHDSTSDLANSPAWREFTLPGAYGVLAFVVTPDDTLYVACQDRTGGPGTVFRRGVTDGSPWEELPVPAAYGLLMALAVDDTGQVWLGGERGEVFRRQGRRWLKEVLPVPLHCDPIICVPGGPIWARVQARGDVRILLRQDSAWRVVASTNTSPTAELLYADRDVAVLNIGTRLHRVRSDLSGTIEPWIDLGTPFVTAESASSAWGISQRRLLHAVDQQILDLGEVPFLPLRCSWHSGYLWAVAESGVWRLATGSGAVDDNPYRPLGFQAGRLPDEKIGEHPTYGVGVLELAGREYVYLARYTTIDIVVPLGTDERMLTWPATTAELGIADKSGDLQRFSVYEMGVATADLNSDGTEEVLLSTMYAGCRLLRNVADRRLVPWTSQSRLVGSSADIVEDVDLLDADADGDLDIYVCVLQGADTFWLNDGAAHFTEIAMATGIQSPYGSTSATCRDFDGDGDTDIVVSSCGSGLYLSENLGVADGIPRFRTSVMLAPVPSPDVPAGLSTDNLTGVEAADFDGDGLLDLVVGGRSQPTRFLRNEGGMRFTVDDSVFVGGPPTHRVMGAVAMDPDADGDWDLALTGHAGTRFLENEGGRLGLPDGARQKLLFSPNHTSAGAALVDADEDGDLDYVEGLIDAIPVLHRNTNPRKPLIVRVRGPQENRSAVGAVVQVLHAGTARRAVALQEIAGGSGYVSHNSKRLAFGGLSPDSLYDVSVSLPSGRRAFLAGVPGHGTVMIDLQPGLVGAIEGTLTRWRAGLRDRWTATFWVLTVVMLAVVAAYGAFHQRRLATSYPWLGVIAVPVIAWGVRRPLHLDPGGMPVIVSALGGLACGLLAVGFARPRPRAATTTMLADFGRSLRVFEHNQTPRRIVDRIMLVRSNTPESADDWRTIVPLLREDVALFGVVVAPELAFVVEGARSAGLEHAEGARLLRQMRAVQQRLLSAADEVWTTPRQMSNLDALLATTEAFRRWTARLRTEVDSRIATRLQPFVREYAAARMALHDAVIEFDVPDGNVRMPAPELTRVLDILLENSVRAAEGRRVGLEIAGRSGLGRVTLSVSDDGPGVPTHLRPRIFDAGVTGIPGGSGFGLYAARRTVEQFGGSIALVDSPAGACFEIELGTIRDLEA